MRQSGQIKRALRAAFPHTIPIFAGFWFLGLTYGIYMHAAGFSFWYPMLMSLTIFAGSVEFVAVNLLLGAFNPLQALAMAVLINARHLFYGISMLDRYRGTGWKKLYLIFGLCDESFSINYTATIPAGVDKGWFYFFVTLLNHLYWFTGATLGGIFGSLLRFNTEGLDFVMTAMFVVIFLDQWLKDTAGSKHRASAPAPEVQQDALPQPDAGQAEGASPRRPHGNRPRAARLAAYLQPHASALLGLGLSLLCLLAFGADNFLIPAMLAILLAVTLLRRPLDKGGDKP